MKTLHKGLQISGRNGNVYTIDSLISAGTGQGDIYRVFNSRKEVFAMKLFHPGSKKKKLLKQIIRLIKRGQACEVFVIPIEIVDYKQQIGYVMEYIGPEYMNAAALFNGVEKDGVMINLPWHVKLTLLACIVEPFVVLNTAKLGIMDIKFDNIKIDLNNLKVKVLDTDTIVYSKDKSVVLGTVGFMPPNTMMRRETPNEFNDVYAIAVLIFMTLMGAHPLDGKRRMQPCNEQIDTYLFGTHPVYMFNPNDASNRPIPQDSFGRNQQQVIDKFNKYPKYFKDAMRKTFVDGLYDGEKRTTMTEWLEILERLYNDSFICEQCGEEYFLDANEKACSVCKQELVKPIFIQSEKSLPIFNGMTIFSDDLWNTTNHYEVFKVVETKYDGRFGLQNLLRDKAVLKLPNGTEKSFNHSEEIPIFLYGDIEIESNKIKFM